MTKEEALDLIEGWLENNIVTPSQLDLLARKAYFEEQAKTGQDNEFL